MNLVVGGVRPKAFPIPEVKCDPIIGKRVPKIDDKCEGGKQRELRKTLLWYFKEKEAKFKFLQHSSTISCLYPQIQWSK